MLEKINENDPFANFNITPYNYLKNIKSRSKCKSCLRSRRYFCYTCFIPMDTIIEHMPTLRLPLKIHIIKHPFELSGKSTATHAKLIAPIDTHIYIYPEIPDLTGPVPKILLFPSKDTPLLENIVKEISLQKIPSTKYPYDLLEAIFVDGTWKQANKILRDDRLQNITCVKLNNYKTCFWRYQRKHSNENLATIEAIYHFVNEFDNITSLNGNSLISSQSNTNHKYDDLLFFYAFMHENIRKQYDGRKVIKAWNQQQKESSALCKTT